MQFYRYWARGNELVDTPQGKVDLVAYGYSNESLEDALRVARERVFTNAKRIFSGTDPGQYYGGDNPLREEVINELVTADGETVIISRNHYGCLVLNTPNVFFADIDQPSPKTQENPMEGLANFFGSLFGGRGSKQDVANDPKSFEHQVVSRIESAINRLPHLVVRLYRTCNGFRAMILNETIPCNVAHSTRLLQEFGSDQLYVSLCRSQDSYRARLSPKPWRCGHHQPTVRFPLVEAAEQQEFSSWLDEYERKSSNFATCALIGDIGCGAINETCQQVAELHDSFALNQQFPLA